MSAVNPDRMATIRAAVARADGFADLAPTAPPERPASEVFA